jgi:hypothetical protein
MYTRPIRLSDYISAILTAPDEKWLKDAHIKSIIVKV